MGLCQSQILRPGAGNNGGSWDLHRAVCLCLRWQGEPLQCRLNVGDLTTGRVRL